MVGARLRYSTTTMRAFLVFASCCTWWEPRWLALTFPPLALLMHGSQEGEALSLITRQLVNDWEEGYRGTLREVET